MSEHIPSSNNQATDEIDLAQLLQLIKKGFKNLGSVFLRIFLFFKKYAIILLGLAVLGVAISFGLNQIISKKLKTDVIVRPNFDSEDYLHGVVEELNAKIRANDTAFFNTVGVNAESLEGFEIVLEEITSEENMEADEKEMKARYLETLKDFKDQGFVIDIIRSELNEKSIMDYKLSFLYINAEQGPEVVQKLIAYINTNEYFDSLKEVSVKNAKSRIENNSKLIKQIDELVDNYSNSLATETAKSGNSTLYFEKESALNVPSLLSLKNRLIKEVEEKNLAIKQQSDFISIINFGSSQEVKKRFFSNRMFMIPLFLMMGFLLYVFIRYLNAKAKEIE